MITSLFDLDRRVWEASRRLASARRALASHTDWAEPPQNPLAPFRPLLRKDMLQEIAEVPDTLLVPALCARVAKLTLARVLWEDEVRIARAWSEPSVNFDDNLRLPAAATRALLDAEPILISPRTLLVAVLVDAEPVRRRRVAEGLARAGRGCLRDAVRFHAERRAAAAAALGVSLDAMELPAPAAAIEAAAADLWAGTDGFAERFAPWDQGLARAMANDATGGWPAHLTPRWVLSIFAGAGLVRDAQLRDVQLPTVLGAASFARGLVAFGEAFGDAVGPDAPPFVLSRPIVDLRPLRLGALFGLLAGDEVFARRALGLGQGAAREHARAFGRAAVAQGRLAAAAVRVRGALFPPSSELDDRFSEATARAWGEPLPAALAGVLPRIAEDTPARFAAALLAALDRRRLIEAFDEDWYRNPHAAEALREMAGVPAPAVTEAILREGTAELGRTLSAAID
jgi:hypothetical protein